jgi:ribose transport system substrate-binding protein
VNRKNLIFGIVPAVSILLIVLLWFAFGGGGSCRQSKEPRIIVVLKTSERVVDFWKILEQGVLQASEDFGVIIKVTGPSKEGNITEQIAILEHAVKERPDVIVLAAADYNKLVEPVEHAVESGVPVLTVDSFINSDIALSQIGTANFEAGGKLAVYLKSKLARGARIGILSYVRESSTAIEREQGLRDGIEGYFEVLPTRYNNDNIEIAADDTKAMLDMNEPPEAIIALNETSARGLLSALSGMDVQDSAIFLTFDSNIEIIEGIESGRISGTVVQKPYNMGYQAVKTAVSLLNGEIPAKRIDTGSELVTAENLYSPVIQKLIFPTVSSSK